MKKVIRLTIVFFASISILLCSHCQTGSKQVADMSIDSLAISQAIHNCIGWAKEKDFDLLYSVIANDSCYIEVDPDGSVIRGIDNFRKNEAFWGSPDFKAIHYEIRDLKINISRGGDVAWFYCILDDINEWKGQPASWKNTRWTGVLEKRDGKWVMMQQHFSFAAE